MKKSSLVLYQGNGFTIQGPKRFRKDILRVGRWKHPVTGQDVEITQERIRLLAAATEQYRQTCDRKAIPFPDGHTFDAKKNLGYWTEFSVEGDRLVGTVEVTDDEAARKIEQGSIRSVSARIDPDVRDTAGTVYAEAMTHVCATPIPVLDGQHDFVKLSREADGLGLLIPVTLSGDEPKEKRMLKKIALALGLPEDATEETVLAAMAKQGKDLKTLEASVVKPEELKAHGLELKEGKVVKLAAAPPADETPAMKALREENEALKKGATLARLADVKKQIKEAVEGKRVTPALAPIFEELASIQAEQTALCLSADGADFQKRSISVAERAMKLLKELPALDASMLSQNAEQQDEEKKVKEDAKKRAADILARTTGGDQK